MYIQDRFALEELYFRCRSLTKSRAKETRKSCTKNSPKNIFPSELYY